MKPQSIMDKSPAARDADVAEGVRAKKKPSPDAKSVSEVAKAVPGALADVAGAAIVTPTEVKSALGLDGKRPSIKDRIAQVARSYYKEDEA